MSTPFNISHPDHFIRRHVGPGAEDVRQMLKTIGVPDMETLIEQTVPEAIRLKKNLQLPTPLSEMEYLRHLRRIAAKNQVFRSYIGLGYYNTHTPTPILRNIFENPGWYTQYTPYQAEIAQGRLEALLNFQTMVCDLTGLPIANASLLDEGTAAAEAMNLLFHYKNKKEIASPRFFVDEQVYPQTLDVLKTRAFPLNIELVVGDAQTFTPDSSFFGVLLQYPAKQGQILDYSTLIHQCKSEEVYVVMATDLLALTLLRSPGSLGADISIGNSQRFGVPMGYGGPHAAFFATRDEFKRILPGRIIGVSVDAHGGSALRMALQTREQHIRREKATSNICTAQALLSIMAGMYAVYHGPEGLKAIGQKVHQTAKFIAESLMERGYSIAHTHFFDTITIQNIHSEAIRNHAEQLHINFQYPDAKTVIIALDETVQVEDVNDILSVFPPRNGKSQVHTQLGIPDEFKRADEYLTHPVFHQHRSESQLMRYIKSLENKDLSLAHAMIPLGSCTMKLNAATELAPVSWPEFSAIHPFAPDAQTEGYLQIIEELEAYLAEITGFAATSLQPNSGAQGEYAGLMVIRAYQQAKGQGHRDIALIPSSAHGTNPASAVMAGLQVVVTACDADGNIDFEDLKSKAEAYKDRLSVLMITYPSTHGVFEEHIIEICELIHQNGGQVYMDGANMNAQVGLTNPGTIGADVCHLNLHKTFAIPHGGGGPGVGPICVAAHLAPHLPGHPLKQVGGEFAIHAISAAPYGSASILLISYAYIRMLGSEGVTDASKYAILNANYIKSRLEKDYKIAFVGKNNKVAHELIVDFRMFKQLHQIEVEDVAKRLIDYGFHAPTMSWPVPGTMMIEPTESEDKAELDRFCDAMLQIRKEIEEIALGQADVLDNVLKNAPHTCTHVLSDSWDHSYSREKAAYPLPYVRSQKFWPSVARVNNSHGDRHLVCTCPPLEAYAMND